VLLEARHPDRAVKAAVADGKSWAAAQGVSGEFLGLRDLWLVSDEIEDCCELSSSIFEEPASDLLESLRLFASLSDPRREQ
jgi:hypothetical protein